MDEYINTEWLALWHHLCARRAELRGVYKRLNAIVPGWGDHRLGPEITELDRLIEVAYARSH